jgi:hypothetical protein
LFLAPPSVLDHAAATTAKGIDAVASIAVMINSHQCLKKRHDCPRRGFDFRMAA